MASVSGNNRNEDFHDAVDFLPDVSSMDLETSINETKTAMSYFMSNRIDEALRILVPRANTSMYHAVGHGTIVFMDAILTYEQQHFEDASKVLKQSMDVCSRYRKVHGITESIGKLIGRTDYDQYSPQEIHAELCYAETLLMKALLTFVEDETLVNFIKAGLKIRSCFNSYTECGTILKTRNWTSACQKLHFESGVCLGIGAFNLIVSMLPSRVVKLLEFIGFSGSKETGIKEIEACFRLEEGLRHVLCVLTLLCYHLYVLYGFSHTHGDLVLCEEIANSQLLRYHEGVLFLFFKGRLEFVKGNVEESITWFVRSWRSQDVWTHFHHLCFWELVWANSVQQQWREASNYTSYLLRDSKWSRTTYHYLKAALLLMLGDKLTVEEMASVEVLMKDAPQWKQRISGKSIPIEKFVVQKVDRFFAQEKTLILPAYELLYVLNFFQTFGKRSDLIQNVYEVTENTLNKLDAETHHNGYDADNKGLVLLMKGAILRLMGDGGRAEVCLNSVIALDKSIKEDRYIVPNAMMELALLYYERDAAKAWQLLENAKRNYTGYVMESRLHFKVHSLQNEMREKKLVDSSGNSSSCEK